jgi:hypothetical protein
VLTQSILQELLTLLYFLNPDIFLNFRSFTSVMEDGANIDHDDAVPVIKVHLSIVHCGCS